jgi:poly(3-hydroxybutyrate) depolymerase
VQVYVIAQGSYVPFGLSTGEISLNSEAYAYVPDSCLTNSTSLVYIPALTRAACKLHIAFHGCKQFPAKIGTQYVLHSGYNEWAESNGYVVLYPQTVASDTVPFNPEGCFDWWGYTGPEYATKLGPQLMTVRNMIDGLQINLTQHL